jgi:hypothetical protein
MSPTAPDDLTGGAVQPASVESSTAAAEAAVPTIQDLSSVLVGQESGGGSTCISKDVGGEHADKDVSGAPSGSLQGVDNNGLHIGRGDDDADAAVSGAVSGMPFNTDAAKEQPSSSTEGSKQQSPQKKKQTKLAERSDRDKHHQSASGSSSSSSTAYYSSNNKRTVGDNKRTLGESAGIALLLSNHALFGLAERACYHFDIIETLRRSGEDDDDDYVGRSGSGGVATVSASGRESSSSTDVTSDQTHTSAPASSAGNSFCGVSSLLECIPQIPPNKQTKKLRRLLRNRVKDFNLEARLFRSACFPTSSNAGLRCYRPPSLPLRPKPTTRVTFAYEMTSLVICIDASSTITSTFGNLGVNASNSALDVSDDGAICALDRLGGMVRRYLTALVEPVPCAAAINTRGDGTSRARDEAATNSAGSNSGPNSWWLPELRVTVLATFPKASSYVSAGSTVPRLGEEGDESGSELGRTSLLVRDYRVMDLQSAEDLASAVEYWALSKVEGIIASRLSQAGGRSNDRIDSMSSSNLNDLLEICDDALASTLPPEGRPAVVLVTDCRSVDCQSVLETLGHSSPRRTDVPIHILDLSATHSHHSSFGVTTTRSRSMDVGSRQKAADQVPLPQHTVTNNYLAFDDKSPFPLGMSDDAEALYDVSRATGGCFLDQALLEEASTTIAGQVPSDSVLHGDHYLAFRRRALRPNALQW